MFLLFDCTKEKKISKEEIKNRRDGTSVLFLFPLTLILHSVSISVFFHVDLELLSWQPESQGRSSPSGNRRPNGKLCMPSLAAALQLTVSSPFWKGLVYFSLKVCAMIHFALHNLFAGFQSFKNWDKSQTQAHPFRKTVLKSFLNFSSLVISHPWLFRSVSSHGLVLCSLKNDFLS